MRAQAAGFQTSSAPQILAEQGTWGKVSVLSFRAAIPLFPFSPKSRPFAGPDCPFEATLLHLAFQPG